MIALWLIPAIVHTDVTHYEETLERDMERIRGKVEEMSVLAIGAVGASLRALTEHNHQLAYSVILRDARIDELEKQIDRLCLEFIVRQQPVAGTLRFAYAAIKINAELERVGDYAESMARQVLMLHEIPERASLGRLQEIADLVIPMLQDAVKAFLTSNVELARQARRVEHTVDRLRHSISRELVGLREERKIPLEALGPLLSILNRFERAADQATNICQEVVYMCTGEYAKHKGTEVYRVLFVDKHQGARAKIAEAVGDRLANRKFLFSSAGLEPKRLDSTTAQFLEEKGVDTSRIKLLSVEQVPNLHHYDLIVALEDDATAAFPQAPTKTVCLEWSVEDPAAFQGEKEEAQAAYERTYKYLETHVHDLVEAILSDDRPGSIPA